MTHDFSPSLNQDHIISRPVLNDVDTWVVIQGTKSVKQLITEELENPDTEWLNSAGKPLTIPALKELAEKYKAKYKLKSLKIKGQVAG